VEESSRRTEDFFERGRHREVNGFQR
jgi:hypothetical protein